MKQTATEFLFEKLWDSPKDKLTWNAILEKAKEMEKQQMKDAWWDGNDNEPKETTKHFAEQYYIETYDK